MTADKDHTLKTTGYPSSPQPQRGQNVPGSSMSTAGQAGDVADAGDDQKSRMTSSQTVTFPIIDHLWTTIQQYMKDSGHVVSFPHFMNSSWVFNQLIDEVERNENVSKR